MKKHRRHIIAIVVTALISVTLYAARTNSDRLSLLQPLLEYNHPFSPDAPVDSIIAWEKLLEPELQKEQQYPLLFQINLLTVQALITEGNISLAINQANQMYQKAREMDYPLGTALALHAIGNTYLVPIYPDEAQLSPNDRYRRQYPGTRICYQQGYESPRRFPPCLLSGILSHPDASSSGSIKLYTTNRTNQPATPVPIFSFND